MHAPQLPLPATASSTVGVFSRLVRPAALGLALIASLAASAAETVFNFAGNDGTYTYEVSMTFDDQNLISQASGYRHYYSNNGSQVVTNASYVIRPVSGGAPVADFVYNPNVTDRYSYATFNGASQYMDISTYSYTPNFHQIYIFAQFAPGSGQIPSDGSPPSGFSQSPNQIRFYYYDSNTGYYRDVTLNTNISASTGATPDDCDHSAYEAQITALEAEVASLESELDSTTAALVAANALLESCNAEVATLEATVDTLTADKAALAAQVGSLESALTAAQADLASTQADLASTQAALTTTQADLASTQAALAAAQDALAAAQQEIAQLTAQVSALQADLAAAQATIAGLTSDLVAANAANAGLQADLAASQAQAATLAVALDGVSTTRATLEASLGVVLSGNTEAEKLNALLAAINGLNPGHRQGLIDQITGAKAPNPATAKGKGK